MTLSLQDAESTQASPTPSTLYRLAAILVQEELVDLDALYSHVSIRLCLPLLSYLSYSQLSLPDTQLKELHDSVVGDAQEMARKANIVTLTVS